MPHSLDFMRRHPKIVCAALLALSAILGNASFAQTSSELDTFESKISCAGVPVTVTTLCSPEKKEGPFAHCTSQKMTIGRAGIDLKAELTKRTGDKGFLGSIWGCVENGDKGPSVYVDFGNGKNCEKCEVDLWITVKTNGDTSVLDVASSGPNPAPRSIQGIVLSRPQ